jgi:hypothetical protein
MASDYMANGVYIRWNPPESGSAWDTVFIESSADNVSFAAPTTFPAAGLAISYNAWFDESGTYSSTYYKMRYKDSVTGTYSDYAVLGQVTIPYITPDEMREFIGISTSDKPKDKIIFDFIDTVKTVVENRMGSVDLLVDSTTVKIKKLCIKWGTAALIYRNLDEITLDPNLRKEKAKEAWDNYGMLLNELTDTKDIDGLFKRVNDDYMFSAMNDPYLLDETWLYSWTGR